MMNSAALFGIAMVVLLLLLLVLYLTPSQPTLTPTAEPADPTGERGYGYGKDEAPAEDGEEGALGGTGNPGDPADGSIDPAAAEDGSACFNNPARGIDTYQAAMTVRPEETAIRDRPESTTRYHGVQNGMLKASGREQKVGEVGSQVPLMLPMNS